MCSVFLILINFTIPTTLGEYCENVVCISGFSIHATCPVHISRLVLMLLAEECKMRS